MTLNYNDFQKAIQELEAFYNGIVLNGGILESTWYQALSRMSADDLNYAIAKCFRYHPRQYNYFPSPEDIRKLAFAEEDYQSSQIFQPNTLELPPENDQQAHKRSLICRLYQHYKIKNKVGKSDQERQEFYDKFSNHSLDQLQTLLEIELHQLNSPQGGIKPSDVATPEHREYLEKLSRLITGKGMNKNRE